MIYPCWVLRDCNTRLNNMAKSLDKKLKDIEKEKEVDAGEIQSRFFGILLDMINALTELSDAFRLNVPMYRAILTMVKMHMDNCNKDDISVQELADAVKAITEAFSSFDYNAVDGYGYADGFRYSYGYSQRKLDTVPLVTLAQALTVPSPRPINLIEIKGYEAHNCREFKNGNTQVHYYGASLPQDLINTHKSEYHKAALGSFRGSSITNEAFDVLFLQPAITWEFRVDNFGIFVDKKERDEIRECMRYLRVGGWMILALPYFRFYSDVCSTIAKNYSDIQLYRFDGEHFRNNKCVYVIGHRKPPADKEMDEEAYTMLRNAYDIQSVPVMPEHLEMRLPAPSMQIKNFRGSVLDVDEIQRIATTSPSVAAFWKDQQVERMSETTKRPLLPFNLGQLGLVMCTGCVDGRIDEGEGYGHVIKGRIVKRSDVQRTIDGQELNLVETVSNRVEINVLLADGTYKVLA